MNKQNGILLLKKIITLMIGLTIAHLGCTLFIQSALGNDPYNVLIQGLFRSLQSATGWAFLTHGRVHIAICFLIIIILLILDRSYIKIGTILCMIFGGPIIDLFTMLLKDHLNEESAMPVRILSLVIGCIVLAFGMSIVIKSDCGTGPNDLVSVVISDKLKKNFGIVRILVDLAFVVVGFLLSGVVGVGTIVCAFLVGPTANLFLPRCERVIKRFYGPAQQ